MYVLMMCFIETAKTRDFAIEMMCQRISIFMKTSSEIDLSAPSASKMMSVDY